MIVEEYITTTEAAAFLGVNSGWVAALCRNGILEATGGGKGIQWSIKRSSVDELAEERRKPVDQQALADVAREIEEDEEAQEFAKQKAEDSFRDRVISISRRYGLGVVCIVAGILGHVVAPGNYVSDHFISAGLTFVLTKASEVTDTSPSPAPKRPEKTTKTSKKRKK
jgi:hypothetical protein